MLLLLLRASDPGSAAEQQTEDARMKCEGLKIKKKRPRYVVTTKRYLAEKNSKRWHRHPSAVAAEGKGGEAMYIQTGGDEYRNTQGKQVRGGTC